MLPPKEVKSQIKLSADVQQLLRCPNCKTKVEMLDDRLECRNSNCGASFPIMHDVQILLSENSSVFPVDDLASLSRISPYLRKNKFKKVLLKLTSLNLKWKVNYKHFVKLLLNQSKNPKVLVISGRVLGEGIEPLVSCHSIGLVEGDVSFGPRAKPIFDTHDIPFEKDSFDGVVIQAVLKHVVDPYRCVEEIYRVLKKQDIIYAETPFMQQMHNERYDFTRFTYLGHRRLFRQFEEIDAGAVCGPGMALSWAYAYFFKFYNIKLFKKFNLYFFLPHLFLFKILRLLFN